MNDYNNLISLLSFYIMNGKNQYPNITVITSENILPGTPSAHIVIVYSQKISVHDTLCKQINKVFVIEKKGTIYNCVTLECIQLLFDLFL